MSAIRDEVKRAIPTFLQKPQILSEAEKYLCDSCESESDVSTHVLFCPLYSVLRQEKDLNNNRHIGNYIKQALEIRTQLRLNK